MIICARTRNFLLLNTNNK